jgi:hypothetical protein
MISTPSPQYGTPAASEGLGPGLLSPHDKAPSSYDIVEDNGAGLPVSRDIFASDLPPASERRPRQKGESSMVSKSHEGDPYWKRDEESGFMEPKYDPNDQSLSTDMSRHLDQAFGSWSRNKKIGAGVLGTAALLGLGYGAYKFYKAKAAKKKKQPGLQAPGTAGTTTPDDLSGSCQPPPFAGGYKKPSAMTNPTAYSKENVDVADLEEGGPGPAAMAAAASQAAASAAAGHAAESAAAASRPTTTTTTTHMVGGKDNAPLVQQIMDMSQQQCDQAMCEKKEEQEEVAPYQKSTEPNYDRTDPITPATGSKQTTDTANSVVGPEILRDMAAKKVKSQGLESLYGNARERANMGKGAMDGYSFAGPYDYPIYPGGRPDDTLTGMGAWRTKNGNQSSLWYSRKTAKGAAAKRNKYYKWSTKGGGNWRKLTKDDMLNVFQKPSRLEGGNFYGVVAGKRFKDLIHDQLNEKEKDIAMGKVGARKAEAAKMGWVDGQKRGAKKRRMMGYDGSAHQ